MKRGYKNLLSVLGALGLVLPFAGCETDAQEAQADAKESSATNSAALGNAGAGSSSSSTNAPASTPGTEAAAASAIAAGTSTNAVSGTNTVSQQTTVILNKIPPTLPANVKLSKGVEEVIKLAQAGLSETVMLLYIEKFPDPFDIDAAEIIYLNDIGIQSTVLAAMLNHDGKGEDVLHDALSTNNAQVVTAPPPPPQTVTQAPPQQIEVTSNYVANGQPGGAGGAVLAQEPVVVQQQPVIVEQPAVTYSYFYSSLAPYGTWVDVSGYGWCWQPTIAVTHNSWRPYMHGGRWLYSDVGWYWHSDYSWGWAPYHYGRWYCAPQVGWVWCPDYTWGPSWVTWRSYGSYCGWAPLPPHCDVRPGVGFSYWGSNVGFSFGFGYSSDYYCWVPAKRFCDRRITDHVVHHEQSRNFYKDSTVVNNYIVGNNNTIVNNGIGRDFVKSHTQGELPRVRVAEASAGGRAVQPDRPTRVGNETVVYRPERPSSTLVRAHEDAVARSRTEVGRRPDASLSVAGNTIPTERPRTVSPTPAAANTGSRREIAEGGSSLGTMPGVRGGTARPQIAARNEGPVFGTPAPVRPEPDRSAEILRSRSRASQEAVVRPNVNPGSSTSAGLVSTRPSGETITVRPATPGNSVAPRLQPGTETATSNGRSASEAIRQRPTGGGSPAVSSPANRSEVARPGSGITPLPPQETPSAAAETVRPNNPSRQPVASSPNFSRPRSAESARSPDLAQPQVARPGGTITQTTPSVSRPAPTPVQPVTPTQVQPVTPSVRSTPGTQPQGNVNISSQPIQRSAPSSQAPARPNVTPRTETFSRPSGAVRSAPAPVVVRPSPSVSRPPASSPSISAPAPVTSSPRVGSSSTPINGGSFRSAPPAAASSPNVSRPGSAPAQGSSRPSAPASSSSGGGGGRGRVEVGR